MKESLIIFGNDATTRILNQLADFLGVPASNAGDGDVSVVIISGSQLSELLSNPEIDVTGWKTLQEASKLFVYGLRDEDCRNTELVKFLNVELDRVKKVSGDEYRVSDASRDFCFQFAGLSFGTPNSSEDRVFSIFDNESVEELITIGDDPFLARTRSANRDVYIVGVSDFVDLDRPMKYGEKPIHFFSQLLPPLMFLRHVFGETCWHSPQPLANLVIDDPWVRERYGFLNYRALIDVLQKENSAVSVAFIPWNYKRSSRKGIERFKDCEAHLSLNVHGCDHTEFEFGIDDASILSDKVRLAKQRMDQFRELTGLSYDRVMVFPQGKFSPTALKVLDDEQYQAAVNSGPWPLPDSKIEIPLRNLISVTVNCYNGVPLFNRHAPSQLEEFALDLFFGKPALGVEHHEYFQNGFENYVDFVQSINSLDPNVNWVSLGEAVGDSYLQRRNGEEFDVQIFTNQTKLINRDSCSQKFRVRYSRRGRQNVVTEVRVDGAEYGFEQVDDEIHLVIGLSAGEKVNLEFVEREPVPRRERNSNCLSDRIKIASRRYLCDFRDNHLSKHHGVMKLAQEAKSIFKAGVAPRS